MKINITPSVFVLFTLELQIAGSHRRTLKAGDLHWKRSRWSRPFRSPAAVSLETFHTTDSSKPDAPEVKYASDELPSASTRGKLLSNQRNDAEKKTNLYSNSIPVCRHLRFSPNFESE